MPEEGELRSRSGENEITSEVMSGKEMYHNTVYALFIHVHMLACCVECRATVGVHTAALCLLRRQGCG